MIEVLSIRLFFFITKAIKEFKWSNWNEVLRSPTDWARRRLSIFPLIVVRDLFAFCHSCYLTVSFTFFSWPWWTSLRGPTLQNFFLSIASGRSLFGSKTQSSSVSNALSLVTSSRDQKHWLFLTPSAYWTSSVRVQQENLRGRRI